MSEQMTINGKKLVPIKEVIGRTKYTRDYIAKLAREGQIIGALVERQWFIDEDSLINFKEVSELELQVRRRQLSKERRREREVKVVLKNEWDIVVNRPRYSSTRGVAKSVAVLACGLLSGYAVYTLPPLMIQYGSFQNARSPLVENVSVLPPAPRIEVTRVASATTLLEQVVFSDTQETKVFPDNTVGVMLLPSHGTASSAKEVAALFSDPVNVRFREDGTGKVSVTNASGSVGAQEITFVTVPLPVTSYGNEQNQ